MAQTVKIEWNGAHVGEEMHHWLAEGLGHAVEFLLGESSPIVPLDEGTLDRSGVASTDDERLEGAVSYDTPYAVIQHENLDYQHDPGRTAKYLERPFMEKQPEMLELIAAPARRGMNDG